MNLHRNDSSLGEVSGRMERAGDVLIVLAMLTGIFGKGRARLPVIFAAPILWALQITGHIGVL
jgi:hypothetical protein